MKEANELNKKVRKINIQRTSKMYNREKGITLIALVITIVILIILATVSIKVVLGEGGLIDRAKQAKDLTEQAALDEQEGLNSLMSEMTNIMEEVQNPPKPEIPTIDDAKPNPGEDGPKFDDTTTITDDLNNPVTIPGGFHIDKDSGTKVEEGIVIEDDSGNQFVWIPTGTYNVTEEVEKITEPDEQDGKLTNALSRRTFTESGSTIVSGDAVIEQYYYGEGDSRSCTIVGGTNSIDAFLSRAKPVSEGGRGGFYIGRYEAGTEAERTSTDDTLTTPLVQANKYPYVYVTRDQAKQKAETMYSGNEEIKATSQLISSYAWDTALNYICQTNEEGYMLATTTSSSYGNIGTKNKTQTGQYKVNGVASDKYSNIYDLLGNCYEWTTEYSSNTGYGNSMSCVNRGGGYSHSNYYAADRHSSLMLISYSVSSFRLQLYVNTES